MHHNLDNQQTTRRASHTDRFAIVTARWNEDITSKLLEAAIETLTTQGALQENIHAVWVPGSFELPMAAQKLVRSNRYAAVICLGAVIQGETQHHDYINHAVAQGIARVSLESGVPVLFGVLTCDNMDQARDRAGGKAGNKGSEAAVAAIEMVDLFKQLD